ncbi:MAG: GNAT family N-acetyltransferase [Bacteriovoracaceae bacterium]|jgi:predicted N-acetyltransferase YhbS|nr:GNAT family N-acetyltransferase [Bacteriovoracaceae bacterium]
MMNLKDQPEYYQQTLSLIEKSFGYNEKYSFAIDFAPLLDQSNWHHCFILLDEEKKNVIAHIALKERDLLLNNTSYKIGLIGGICVEKEFRGKGIFKSFIEKVMRLNELSYLAYLLWSDQADLYSKFNFYQVGGQIQLGQSSNYNLENLGFERTDWIDISASEFLEITNLYDQYISKMISIKRSLADWNLIKKIHSTKLYIKRSNNEIVSYLFLGKGQDLQGIIHEFIYKEGDGKSLIAKLNEYKLWLPEGIAIEKTNSQSFYTTFLRISDPCLFKEFVNQWSNGKVKIVSFEKDKLFFQFLDKEYNTNTEEFLKYLLGPSPLMEFKEFFKPFLISGLDSI